MRGAECVVHVDIGEGGKLARELRVVRLLFLVEPKVLEEHHAAGGGGLDGIAGDRTDAILGEVDFLPEQVPQPPRDRRQRKRRILALRPAEVRAEDDDRALLLQVLDRGEGLADARVIGDGAVCERNVEIRAHQHPFAGDVDVANGLLANACLVGHAFVPSAAIPRRSTSITLATRRSCRPPSN